MSPLGDTIHMFAFMLPGYTDAAKAERLCEIILTRRPVIFIEGSPVPLAELGGTLPVGIDPSWFSPLRAALARDWHTGGDLGVGYVLVPNRTVLSSPDDCGSRE